MEVVSAMKKCTGKYGCKRILPYSSFGIDSRNKSGRKTLCKFCEKKYKAQYYLKTREQTYYIVHQNVLEEDPIYTQIKSKNNKLLNVVYEFARTCGDDDLYNTILHKKIAIFLNDEAISIE